MFYKYISGLEFKFYNFKYLYKTFKPQKMKTRSNPTQKTVVLSLIIFIVFFGSILFQI